MASKLYPVLRSKSIVELPGHRGLFYSYKLRSKPAQLNEIGMIVSNGLVGPLLQAGELFSHVLPSGHGKEPDIESPDELIPGKMLGRQVLINSSHHSPIVESS